MSIKVVKLVPNEFVNASRDLRELSVLMSLGCDITVIAKQGKSEDTYGFNCVRLTTRPIYKWIKNLNANRIVSVFLWAKTVNSLNPNIISCHNLDTLIIGWIANILTKHKSYLVYDSHEFEYARDEKRGTGQLFIIKHLERFLMKRCAFSMMVNDSIADEVVKLHHLKERPVVIRNFPRYWQLDEKLLSMRKLRFKEENNIPTCAPLILYQGGLVKRRGIENAIKALSKVDGAYLIIMGNGNSQYIDYLHMIVAENHISDRAIFLPAAPYSDLWKYTGIADIGLCILENVCLNHYLALPNKCLEYVQALVPVITSNFPELRRIVYKYEIGECCNADDVNELADVIRKLITNEDLLNKYKVNLQSAKDCLCWEREEIILKDAYQKLLLKIDGYKE